MSIAQEIDRIPRPITPGPEMKALRRFHKDVTWTGTIHEGGRGRARRVEMQETASRQARGDERESAIEGGRR